MMARGGTWGPWPPPHAHGFAQQQCPNAQAGPSKGLGQPMTPSVISVLVVMCGSACRRARKFGEDLGFLLDQVKSKGKAPAR